MTPIALKAKVLRMLAPAATLDGLAHDDYVGRIGVLEPGIAAAASAFRRSDAFHAVPLVENLLEL